MDFVGSALCPVNWQGKEFNGKSKLNKNTVWLDVVICHHFVDFRDLGDWVD